MPDQVQYLLSEPSQNQIGRPPCNGKSSCTDNVGCIIVFHETRRLVTPLQFRRASSKPAGEDCLGLNPSQFLRALSTFGVRGYQFHANVSASDVIKATDNGVVLVGVAYRAYPTTAQCEIGGKTDLYFTGAHAISLWGRRYWAAVPAGWPAGKHFVAGWRVWVKDPDHIQGWTPLYDRFLSSYLQPMMNAIKATGWATTFAIWKG